MSTLHKKRKSAYTIQIQQNSPTKMTV